MRILWWLVAGSGWMFGTWVFYRSIMALKLLADTMVKLQSATDGWKETIEELQRSRDRETRLIATLGEVRTGLQDIATNAATRDAVRRIMVRAAKSDGR